MSVSRALPRVAMILLVAWIVGGCSNKAPIAGDYTGVSLPAHSLNKAMLDIYGSFTCTPCQDLYPKESELQTEFGERLVIRNHFTLDDGEEDAPMRLYLLAQDAGKGDVVGDALMRARLPRESDNKVLVLVAFIATSHQLRAAYDASLGDAAMNQRISEVISKTKHQLEYKPALILNHQMMFGGDMANAKAIIAGAMKTKK